MPQADETDMTRLDGSDVSIKLAAGWLSRERALALALVAATCVVGYLCYRVIRPFLPCLAWALALAVIAHPLHRWLKRSTARPTFAAAIAVFLVAVLLVTPATFVLQHLGREATRATLVIQESLSSGRWRTVLADHPRLKSVEGWIESRLGLDREGEAEPAEWTTRRAISRVIEDDAERKPYPERAASMVTNGLGTLLTGTVWLGMQVFVTFMTLFFFFRDRVHGLEALRSLMPLSASETDEVFSRINDTIHATIYGSVVVALVQGSMGGLMFWWLGLPSPLLWGAVMALLAVVPVLGTFVIWAPTAGYLALHGQWTKALILVSWGAIAIGLIDNLLYPFLVGSRIRFHTLLVFFAIAGGLALFGASGIVLGPLVLTVADALVDIWKRRTAYGGTVDSSPSR